MANYILIDWSIFPLLCSPSPSSWPIYDMPWKTLTTGLSPVDVVVDVPVPVAVVMAERCAPSNYRE